ncbi:MAG: hypothetical protein ACK4JB_20070 [Reyranella sp.]
MSDITAGSRVSHLNRGTGQSYGTGEVAKVLQVLGGLRPPSKAFVRFDGERADRLVWLDDLTVIVTPAPMPGSRETARICWPLERAGEPVLPGAA